MIGKAPHRVVALAYDGLCTFEFGIVVEVFGTFRPELGGAYAFQVGSAETGPLRAVGGLLVSASAGLEAFADAGTVVIPGWRDPQETPPRPLLEALVAAHERGVRLVSLCSGAYVLAAAGLLDGRRATTHWRYAEDLATRFPRIDVLPDVLYVDEGQVLTSAGSAAGIDLLLHVVRSDLGAVVANTVARRLVVPSHRDGGQSQFIATPVATAEEQSLSKLLSWLRAHLDASHTVDSIARRMHMSPRTLARRFKQATGTSPHRWLMRERVLWAQRELETTAATVDQVAARCGFGSGQLLRLHFRRQVGTTPTAYRRAFSAHQVVEKG